jgi:prepilin-type N-terminal cleavage/methylation domain-containing protein/prepilin-type processing-associated H-X9-DG protein
MRQSKSERGFTLVELLVVVVIIAVLGALALPAYNLAVKHAQCTGCAARMRTLGIAFMSFANDNNGQLPGRVEGAGNDKWPILLEPYISDPEIYVDPGDPVATKIPGTTLLSNNGNNSSFFFNGFNDLGFYGNPNATISFNNITNSSNVLLLAEQVHGSKQYYMDFVEGNQDDVLNKTSYFGGSNYVFADGSISFMYQSQYLDSMWLVNKNYVIPPIPAGH